MRIISEALKAKLRSGDFTGLTHKLLLWSRVKGDIAVDQKSVMEKIVFFGQLLRPHLFDKKKV